MPIIKHKGKTYQFPYTYYGRLKAARFKRNHKGAKYVKGGMY